MCCPKSRCSCSPSAAKIAWATATSRSTIGRSVRSARCGRTSPACSISTSATARARRRRWARPSIARSRKKSCCSLAVSDDSPPASIDDAIAAFNRGAYFEAAEMFESASRAAGDDHELKALIVAFNQIAAALHLRFERGGRQASINLMSQAMLALDDLKPARAGVDVERLCAELAAYTEEVRATPRDERDGLKHRARIFLERRRAPKINRR